MHSAWSRVNAVLTFFGSALAVLCVLTTLTDMLHAPDPSVNLRLTEVKRLAPWRNRYDQAVLSVGLEADLRSCFSWNTKQLFVFVQAEYATEKHGVNQVVIWDRIIRTPEEAVISIPALKQKYALLDRATRLRGREVNLSLAWSSMPKVGALSLDKRSFPVGKLPEEYVY
ncbi:signal peptidase complex subunit 3B [Raphidocelis subcapitata]|uniref:Signal peptidase complex subunit 3 n=1 Tax=Raphidocelis subcapitata TaxID=307507 RepID=A0A2V0NS82_9CHLO|nr:signal peptidase complex subunit 3B [Raphidocelis subcapitata]|eukprot:GBF90486.1 signal peptidase complex subunit 3B [Raphidocelis subcapitata]